MNADTVAEPGVLSEGRIPRSTIRLAELPVFGLIIAIMPSPVTSQLILKMAMQAPR